jgi:UDP-N-acetylmuramoylalanine--D-glutamate ligase
MTTTARSPSVVVGMGRSGIGAARLLQARGRQVLVLEHRDGPTLQARASALAAEGIEVRLNAPLSAATFSALPSRPIEVIISPGIPWDHPVLENIRQQGIAIHGELVPAWEAMGDVPWIGITGTNGKTTVTELVHHILKQGGLDAPLCGNVGVSAAELALERMGADRRRPDWLVVEVSSYQIEAAPELAPAIGVWTTLTPDHLERHYSLDNYRAIKRRLLDRSRTQILNADDADLRAHSGSWERADWVTTGNRNDLPDSIEPLLWIEANQVRGREGVLFPADCLAMPGRHNLQNLMLATAVAVKVGLDPARVEDALRCFPGVPHRLEHIRIREGIDWFNDSKATNYDAAEVAVKALKGPLVVLAGGQSKQGDASAWLSALHHQAAAVVLYGAAREEFRALLRHSGYPGQVVDLPGLAEAVPIAADLAEATSSRCVVLSPACASFDQYADFEARGDHFRQLVEAL